MIEAGQQGSTFVPQPAAVSHAMMLTSKLQGHTKCGCTTALLGGPAAACHSSTPYRPAGNEPALVFLERATGSQYMHPTLHHVLYCLLSAKSISGGLCVCC